MAKVQELMNLEGQVSVGDVTISGKLAAFGPVASSSPLQPMVLPRACNANGHKIPLTNMGRSSVRVGSQPPLARLPKKSIQWFTDVVVASASLTANVVGVLKTADGM